jgi:DNA-binding GntR family transcriptional regulator
MGQEVAEVLRWRIIDGSMPSGTRLTEEKISIDMGLSRGPVREALRELEKEGLVAVEAYRGAVVLEISRDELANILIPTRWILEKHAVTTFVPGVTEEELAALRLITEQMRTVAMQDTTSARRELVELDISYHRYVIDRSNLVHTKQLWQVILPRIRAGFYRLGLQHHALLDIAVEHEVLLQALGTRDVEVALKELDHHVRGSALELLARESGG